MRFYFTAILGLASCVSFLVGARRATEKTAVSAAGAGALEPAPLGNSGELRVGEWVCAIGNPLGYGDDPSVGQRGFVLATVDTR